MSNSERGRRTGQHEQPTQQAVMFTSCCDDHSDPFEERSIDPNSPFPVPPLKLTYIVSRVNTKPWDIQAYVQAAFIHPERVTIEYEVECDGCAELTPYARECYIGESRRILCADCMDQYRDQILETRLRAAAEEE